MPKIRRGNYIFLGWVGDHSPRHVHVYRDGQLVVKRDLDNWQPMKGHASRRIGVFLRSWSRRATCEDHQCDGEQPPSCL